MYLGYGLESVLTTCLTIGATIIVLAAHAFLSSSYKKYRDMDVKSGKTGFEVAREILDKNGLSDVHIVEVSGELSDHYDPSRKVVRLSHEIFNGKSIASVSVAAHEVGHAIQDKEGYSYMRFRSKMIPFVNFGSKFGYIAIMIGLIASIFDLAYIGLFLLSLTLVFQLITLPVEFNASARAKEQLARIHVLDSNEAVSSEKMLKAAAYTYVASLISTLLNMLRLLIMINNRRGRR